jgi:hypothetical protein
MDITQHILAASFAVPDNSYEMGVASGELIKQAGDAVKTPVMTGVLYRAASGWGLLSVPNAFVRGVFSTMSEPGITLPYHEGKLNAHISVFRADELEAIGANKINEWGKRFKYQLGPIETVVPHTWSEMSRVWFVHVESPELKQLRRTYGLSPLPNDNQFNFHITVAVRPKGALQNNGISKTN